ncbi:MAG: hypothetical protein JKY34_12985 [Kordiimonadaceae bacterium]|nr:hypothetical protein [Kordiimonadaceae bacterium]
MNEHLGIIYEVATGHIVKNIRMLRRFTVMDHYELREGQAFLIGQNAEDIDGFKVEADALAAIERPTPTIEQIRRGAKEDIDRAAGVCRSEVASQGYGQEMTYLAKEVEARACIADAAPVAATYPMMAAEVGITGTDLAAVATEVVARADAWKALAGSIERVRLAGKQSIDAATTEAEIDTILTDTSWPN